MATLEEAGRTLAAEGTRIIFKRASAEARLREQDYPGPEHILKAIVELDRRLFDRKVKRWHLDPAAVVERLNARLAKPQATAPEGPRIAIEARVNGVRVPTYPAPWARVLHAALREALKKGRRLIEPRDLLAALCRGPESFLAELMEPGRSPTGRAAHRTEGQPGPETDADVLATKIHKVITGRPVAKKIEELRILLKKTRRAVRVSALQKAAAPQQGPGKQKDNVMHCSFCQKQQSSVKKLIAGGGQGFRVCICDECIEICNEIIADDPRTPDVPPTEGL